MLCWRSDAPRIGLGRHRQHAEGEIFYWVTITFRRRSAPRSATGSPTPALGYGGGALVFAAALAVVAALYYWTRISRVLLFWAAFILTRPLGATVGDLLDKPVDHGGLAFSRPLASAVLAVFILACLLILPQRAGRHPGERAGRGASLKSRLASG